ncbi:MAG: adenylate/guanylate cyclase domain-containing protein [Actinomycetota bacterium]
MRSSDVLERMISIAVVDGDDHELVRLKRLAVGILWLSIPVSVVSAIQIGLMIDAPEAGAVIATAAFVNAGAIGVLWRWPNAFPGVLHPIIASVLIISGVLTIMAGGLLASGFNAIWGFIAILAGLTVFADRRATFWMVAFLVSQVLAVAVAVRVEPLYEVQNAEMYAAFNLVAVVAFVYISMYYYVRQRATLLDRSDQLLTNALPGSIAERLKAEPGVRIADSFEEASILFADVVGFTPMSTNLLPGQLIELLDEIFSDFDRLVQQRDLEKIKTIGDEYMVAAGIPEGRQDHAHILCDLALEMRTLVQGRTYVGQTIQLRIGINSGPVVAGIVGTEKFSYDLWGDAVNTASRMQSTGLPGEIQITESTMRLVQDRYDVASRGIIDVKGKGPTPTWFLADRRTTGEQ